MSVKTKAIFLFFGLYIGSFFLLLIFSLIVIRSTLKEYILNYMEYQVNPIIEFYRDHYKNPHHYAKLLSEEVVSREIASILINEKGKIVHKEGFLDGELPEIKETDISFMTKIGKGIHKDYAFVVKNIDSYKLLLLGKLDRIEEVERRILFFTITLMLFISMPASLLMLFLLNNLLKPLSYLRDLSEAISKGNFHMEVKVSGRKDEFGLLEEAYANMIERLRGTIFWQREFISNITHAIKTPLAYIKGQVELLQINVYPEDKLREIYHRIQVQGEKMERLVNQLSTIMRLESQVPLRVEKVSINQIFAELEEEYEFIKDEKSFFVEYLDEDVEIEVDKEYFKMALRNLIENAYKYTGKGGIIRLYFKDNCIVVEDNGIGMEHPEKAGELFYREATYTGGSGLGLYIVKLISQKSGMTMKVESQRGKGTKVSLCYNI